MKVYRYLSAEELNYIINGNRQHIGNFYHRNDSNSHRYNMRERYLHFFKKKENCKYVKVLREKNEGEWFFATFDIPFHVLLKGAGFGYYESDNSGYDIYCKSLLEFAVKVSDFDTNWLVNFEPDEDTLLGIKIEQGTEREL